MQLGELSAGFRDVVEVALGPGGSVATRFEEVYAAMGGSEAAINVVWNTTAGPSGYAARYLLQAMVNDGDFRAATLMMDVPSNPLLPTRIVFDADQTVITTDGGLTVSAMFDSTGAIIRNLRVGTIEGPTGNFWNLSTGAFRVSGGT